LLTKFEILFLAFHDCLSGLLAELTGLLATSFPTQLRDEATKVTNIFLIKYRSVRANKETEFSS
jgi:hypothetical protein